MSRVRVLEAAPLIPNWTDRLDGLAWRSWARLEMALRADPNWKPHAVDSVAAESFRVLRHLPDPKSNGMFQGRGLVVGYVQSGKTANYTAVAARAVDAGYRLIIVLSGIHDSLRNQTQARLQRELVQSEGEGPEWRVLTGPEEDFRAPDARVLDHRGPLLIVAKKIVPVLERLDAWLESAGDGLHWLPTLIVDDEADLASINTRSTGRRDLMVSESDDTSSNQRPSATNATIRSILRRLPKVGYIAYTATPFANILIDPHAVDPEVGEDLFPRDFAIQLPRPDGYIGTEELFGVSAGTRQVVRHVPDEDVLALRASRRRRPTELTVSAVANLLPATLSDALLTFCLAGAIREIRANGPRKAHTMLVHVSHLTSDQTRIAGQIREQLDLWRDAVRQGQDIQDLLADALRRNFSGVKLPASEKIVLARARDVLTQLVVLELNSITGENLEYDERPCRHIVAVGGNRLSRGLTLEGLTVSYFLRTATMSDTLLQMARWYGFRAGYEDLIRIWTTDGIARWFAELAIVEQALRDALVALSRAGRRPYEMAIRLRAHSELLLTSRNKAVQAVEVTDSWSGEHPQTVLLPLNDHRRLRENRTLAESFIQAVRPNFATEGGWLAQDVPADQVAAFLRAYHTHDEIIAFRAELLAEWIMRRAGSGELTDWSVFLAGASEGQVVTIGGCTVGTVTRSRTSSESIGILIDPRHEGVDLVGGAAGYRRGGRTYDSAAMRRARPNTQGLLLVYPLDPLTLGVAGTDAVIAVALSLPHTSDASSGWIVNKGVSDG